MQLTDRIIAIGKIPPFRTLQESERALIAEAMEARNYQDGDIISRQGEVLPGLVVVVSGGVKSHDGAHCAPQGAVHDGGQTRVIGLPSLLFNAPLPRDLTAMGEGGTTILCVRKSHFFTIVHECPQILAHFLEGQIWEDYFEVENTETQEARR